jgi:hypothetical protein
VKREEMPRARAVRLVLVDDMTGFVAETNLADRWKIT